MEFFMLWILPILAITLLFRQWKRSPSGWRKWYYIVLMLVLVFAMVGKNLLKVF